MSASLLEPPIAPLPLLNDDNIAFWQGGRDGLLLINRCQQCGFYVHPPGPVCPSCYATDVRPEPVSGRATLASFTVNHQPWMPDMTVPFVIAVVELEEQSSVRLTTNIVGATIEQVRIGMPLYVQFVERGDVWLPVFAPEKA